MKNVKLGSRTVADIDGQVAKVLRGLGNPEPPIDLRVVRDLLNLDRGYYSTTDDGLLREIVSRLKVAGRQILSRPTILRDAICSLVSKRFICLTRSKSYSTKISPKSSTAGTKRTKSVMALSHGTLI